MIGTLQTVSAEWWRNCRKVKARHWPGFTLFHWQNQEIQADLISHKL